MWGSLVAAVAVLLLLMYMPGYLLLRSVGRRRSVSLSCAPLFTLVGYSILAVIYAKAGIACSWLVLFTPLIVLGILLLVLHRMRMRKRAVGFASGAAASSESSASLPHGGIGFSKRLRQWLRWGSVRTFIAYLIAGVCGALLIFVPPLGSADAFVCAYDNVHHLGVARAFVESGNWSMFEVTMYPGEAGAYYPSANSLMAALVLSSMDVPVPLALNAVNIVASCFFYPLGMWLLMVRVFGWRDSRTYAGAACCMLFLACPWVFMTYGAPTLFAYLLGVSVLPGFAVLLMDCFGAGPGRPVRARVPKSDFRRDAPKFFGGLAIAFVALIAVAFAHPCVAFSGILFAIVYIAYVLVVRTRGMRIVMRILWVALWLAVCAAVWFALSRVPSIQAIVTYSYDLHKSFFVGGAAILTFWVRYLGCQYVLGFLALVGIVACFLDGRRRWVLLPYFAAAALAFACLVIPMGDLRIVLTGFWYNHYIRLAAAVAIFGTPVVVQGAGVFMGFAALCMRSLGRRIRKGGQGAEDGPTTRERRTTLLRRNLLPARMTAGWVGALAVAIIVLMVALLPLPIPKSATLLSYEKKLASQYDPNGYRGYLEEDERDFCQRAAEICAGGGVVLNAPNDGSAYLYGLYGTDVLVRHFYSVEDGTDEALVAAQIDKIASDKEVAAAAKRLGLEYVLRLDLPDQGSPSIYPSSYDAETWEGIYAIEDDTPGFEVVMSEGDMRLYRIVLDG